MEPTTTQNQFQTFVDALSSLTDSLGSSLFYGGIFICFIVLPIYAIFLMRRRVLRRMEDTLTEILTGDPWENRLKLDWNPIHSGQALGWLRQLAVWHHRYRQVRILFGLPDLSTKFLQVFRALVQVFVVRIDEVRTLPESTLKEIEKLLRELNKRLDSAQLSHLLGLLNSSGEEAKDEFESLQRRASHITTWKGFLEVMRLPRIFSPGEAARSGELDVEATQLAIFVFARSDVGFQDELEDFLVACYDRFGKPMQGVIFRIDMFLGAECGLMDRLQRLFAEKQGPERALSKYSKEPAWQKFVLAFGQHPFSVFDAEPDEGYPSLKKKYRKRMLEVHPDRCKEANAAELTRIATLAWEVIDGLHKKGLLTGST